MPVENNTAAMEVTPHRGEFKRSAALLGTGAVLNQVLQAATIPVIGRLYGPQLFGEWALLQNIGLLIATLAGLRYEQAVVIAEDGAEAIDTSLAQIYSAILIAGIALLVIFWIPVSLLGHISVSKVWLAAAPLLGILTAFGYLTTNCQVRLKRFGPMAAITFSQSAVMVFGQIAGAFLFHRSFPGLVFGGIAGAIVPLGVLVAMAWGPRRSIVRQLLTVNRTIRAARKHANFAKYVAPWALVGSLRERGFVILLSVFTNDITVGYYSLALRLVWAPQGLAGQSMSTVIYQRAAEEKDVSRLAPLVRGILAKMILLGAPAFMFLAWFAGDLMALLLGQRWSGAGPFVVALCAPALTLLLQGWMTLLLAAVGAQRAGFLVELSYTIAGLAIFGTTLAWSGNGLFAVQTIAVITVAYNLAFLLVYYKMCHFPFQDLMRVLGNGVLVCAASAAVLGCVAALLTRKEAMIASFILLTAYSGVQAFRWKRV